MSWINGLRTRVRQFLQRDAEDERMAEEFRFHLEMEAGKNVLAGDDPGEARRRAIAAFGGVAQHAETIRGARRLRLVEDVWLDLRFAIRTLRRDPVFTAVAIGTLAVGIGAATATFSVFHSIALRALPVRGSDDIVVAWKTPAASRDHLPFTFTELGALRNGTHTFASIAGVAFQGAVAVVMLDAAQAVPLRATWVTGDLFQLLGVEAERGRTLHAADDVPGAENVMVISDAFWRQQFGGSSSAIGRALSWNGKRFTIVGVMPRGFDYPRGAQVWLPVLPSFPATLEAGAAPSTIMVFDLVGRLRAGASVQAATADIARVIRAGDAQRAAFGRDMMPVVNTLRDRIVGDVRPILDVAAAAAALLLLIACINVANLQLLRGSVRTQELAIRAALGAGRSRLIRQLMTESTLLAVTGGEVGVVIAFGAVRLVRALAPAGIPQREMIGIDARVLLIAIVATLVTALLTGLLPAALSSRRDISRWLRAGAGDAAASRKISVLRRGLVIGQVALAVLVVTSAGLLVRSLRSLERADMGFNGERLIVLETISPSRVSADHGRAVALQEAMVESVAAMPGVLAATAMTKPPFSAEGGWIATFSGESQSAERQATNPPVNFEVVGPGYFATLGLKVTRGREFGSDDAANDRRTAIVSAELARHAWPDADPIGQRIRLGGPGDGEDWHTVVGVVGETRYHDLTNSQQTLYLPTRQFAGPVPMTLGVRTRVDDDQIVAQLRALLLSIDPELQVVNGGTMQQLLKAPLAQPRFGASLLGLFAMMTLLLALVGVYGAMSASVTQRSRDLSIRLALGAMPRELLWLVLREGLLIAGVGSAIGIVLALTATGLLRNILFGVRPTDALTFGSVALLVLAATVVACWIPARRASRLEPMQVLRGE
jgi:predicted permease